MPITSLVEVVSDRTDVHISPERVLLDVPQGLHHTMAMIILVIWYIASGATLFLNKYILSHLHGDAFILGMLIPVKLMFIFIDCDLLLI